MLLYVGVEGRYDPADTNTTQEVAVPPEDPSGQDPNAGGQDPPSDPSAGGLDPKAAADELARARAEAAKYRTDLRQAQQQIDTLTAKEKERTDAEKTELQRATERIAALEHSVEQSNERVRQALLRSKITAAAARANVIDPDDVHRLLDPDAVQWDGETPTNVDDLLTSLVESKPYLVRQGTAPTTARTSTSPTNPPSGPAKAGLTRQQVEAMSEDEINARYDEVTAFLESEGSAGRR